MKFRLQLVSTLALLAACDDDNASSADTQSDAAADTATGDTSPADTGSPDAADTNVADTAATDTAPADTTPDVTDGPCDFTACGGDGLAGAWSVVGFCTDAQIPDPFGSLPGCEDAVFTFDPTASGTITFKADGTYSMQTTLLGSLHVEVSAACLTTLGMASCDAFAAQLSEESEVTCQSADGGGCTCEGGGTQDSIESGTWTVSGDELTTTPEEGSPDTVKVCVRGDTAKVQSVDSDGDAPVSTIIALERQ